MTGCRAAMPADEAELAALHLRLWHLAYDGIAPPEVAATLDLEARRARWRASLAAPPPQATRVAVADGRIVGFVSCGAPSDPVYAGRGEVKHLFLDPSMRRRGTGRSLMGWAARHLGAAGFTGLGLGVLAENPGALGFYRALGGRLAGEYTDAGPIWRSRNLLIVWDDLTALAGEK